MNGGSDSSTGTGALSVRGSGQRVVPTRSGIPTLDWLTDVIWHDGKLFGIDWSVWKVVGWAGNVVFFSRFFVQWYATEKLKRVVVPVAFWWLSLSGSFLLLIYSLRQRDSVFIFAYAFTWIPVHPKPDDSLPSRRGALGLPGLWQVLGAASRISAPSAGRGWRCRRRRPPADPHARLCEGLTKVSVARARTLL